MSLCCCDPEKKYNTDCFAHGDSEKTRQVLDSVMRWNKKLDKKLKVAMTALKQITTAHKNQGSWCIDVALKALDDITKLKKYKPRKFKSRKGIK